MGLDQYLYVNNPEDTESVVRIGYWRKHANLQGFMEEKWRAQGGEGDFNLTPLVLTEEICREVIERSRAHSLPHTTGFFFGASEPEDDIQTVGLMEQAIEFIQQGRTVTYDSWW